MYPWLTPLFLGMIVVVSLLLMLRRVPLQEVGSVAVSTGLLGTFTGILIALLGFDTTNIDQSVPILIEGMKTAFATSVVGVAVAVLLRIVDAFLPKSAGAGGVSPEAYYAVMREQADQLKQVAEQSQKLNGIAENLGGAGEGSVITQIQKLRMEMRDFAKEVSSSSTEAIVESLQEVITNFNEHLATQFGENFRELNVAVGKLNDWMKLHKALVEASQEQMETAIENHKQAVAGITAVQQGLQQMSLTVASLEQALGKLAPELEKIATSTDAVAESTKSLGTASQSVRELVQQLTVTTRALRVSIPSLVALAEQTPAATESLKQAAQAVETTFDGIRTQQTALTQKLATDLRDANQRNAAAVNEQLEAFDEQMGKQLSQALGSLGESLATLSGKFVEDYQPLAERLREVVRIAERIDNRRRPNG